MKKDDLRRAFMSESGDPPPLAVTFVCNPADEERVKGWVARSKKRPDQKEIRTATDDDVEVGWYHVVMGEVDAIVTMEGSVGPFRIPEGPV